MNQRDKMSDPDNPLSCSNPMRNAALHHNRGGALWKKKTYTEPQSGVSWQIKTIIVKRLQHARKRGLF